MMPGELERLYGERLELYERALREAKNCIGDIVRDFAAEGHFRVARGVESRIKSPDSLKLKAHRHSVPVDRIFETITDVAGIRVVANNLSDLGEVVQRIKVCSKIRFDPSTYEDKVAAPDPSGYRAVHFVVWVKVERTGRVYDVPCEIQVRTLLQDSWAVLSQADIYKGSTDIPPVIQKLSRRLADQLAVLDQVAQDIRDELSKVVEPPTSVGDEEPLTKEAIGLVFYEMFGEKSQEWELQSALNELREAEVSTVSALRQALPPEDVRRKLDSLHKRYFGGWPVNSMDVLVWGIKVARMGESAYAEYTRRLKGEWQEVEQFARREILSDLPKNLTQLLRFLREDGEARERVLLDAVRELGGLGRCRLCGTEIFQPYRAYEALCGHYGRERPELLDLLDEMDVRGTLIESEGGDHSGLCPHCAHLLYSDNT